MRKSFLALALVVALAFCTFGHPAYAALKEGEDYVVLKKTIPAMDKTLLKLSSYDCPFCYKYDLFVTPAVVKAIEKDGMRYTEWHLDSGKYGPQANEIFAALITKDRKAGLGPLDDSSSFKKAKMAYYQAYHVRKERWGDGEDPEAFLKTGLEAAGVSRSEFQKLLKERATRKRLKEWEGARELSKIQGVPAFVVNGKYLLYNRNIRSIEGLTAAIRELMEK
jgi:protein-disulfide isomerase